MTTRDRGRGPSRRTLLKGLGAAAASLPLLRSFPASAAAAAAPKLLLIGVPAGNLIGPYGGEGYAGWRPAGYDGGDGVLPAELPHIFRPLERHRDRLLLIEGLGYPIGGTHQATPIMLTGTRPAPPFLQGSDNFYAGGPSIDWVLSQELGVQDVALSGRINGFLETETYWAYRGANQPITPIQDPREAFDSLLGSVADDPALRAKLTRRKSILDVVAGDLGGMKARLPAEDRVRIEAHLEATRAIEQGLDRQLDGGASCSGNTRPGEYSQYDDSNLPRLTRDQLKIAATALQCGVTQVASFQMGNFGGYFRPNWPEFGVSTGYHYHAVSHAFAGEPGANSEGLARATAVELALKIEVAISTLIAEALDELTARLDTDGRPLLDNTLVVVMRAQGMNHNSSDLLTILAGGSGVKLRGGRFIQRDQDVNDLLTGIARAMGSDISTFGDAAYNTSPLSFE